MFKCRKLGLVAITFPKRHKIHAFGNSLFLNKFSFKCELLSQSERIISHIKIMYKSMLRYMILENIFAKRNFPYNAHYSVTASVSLTHENYVSVIKHPSELVRLLEGSFIS